MFSLRPGHSRDAMKTFGLVKVFSREKQTIFIFLVDKADDCLTPHCLFLLIKSGVFNASSKFEVYGCKVMFFLQQLKGLVCF